jgi:hypothetical protein
MLPYRLLQPESCVVPWDRTQLLDGRSPRIDLYPQLASWWRTAENLWLENRSSERLTLLERLDFRHGFRNQFPVKAQRVVYSKAGMHLAAARVTDGLVICTNGRDQTSPSERPVTNRATMASRRLVAFLRRRAHYLTVDGRY